MPADNPDWEWLPAVHYGRGRQGAEVTAGVDHFTAGGRGRAVAKWVAGLSVYKGEKVPAARVSGHILTCRDGHVIQQVSLADRAYHAGTRPGRGDLWKGEEPPRNVNDFTIGVENSNYGWLLKRGNRFYVPRWNREQDKWEPGKPYDYNRYGAPLSGVDPFTGKTRHWEPYKDEMIQANINVKRFLLESGHVVTREDWAGHSDVSPTRKSDPGPLFPIDYILDEVFGAVVTQASEFEEDDDDVVDITELGHRQDDDLCGHYDEEAEMCVERDA
jgi:N-acetyl-anhydromuramyl-L-alanine amidase AmpD